MSATSQSAVSAVVTPAVAECGFVVEEVTVSAAGKRSVVRVLIDLAEGRAGSITLDDIATASRAISDAMDDAEPLGDRPYVLEVSSPGTDRPLTLPRHWSRARGRLVVARLHDGGTCTGRIMAVTDTGVTIDDRNLTWDQLVKGTIEVEFTHVALDDHPEDDITDDNERAEGN